MEDRQQGQYLGGVLLGFWDKVCITVVLLGAVLMFALMLACFGSAAKGTTLDVGRAVYGGQHE